MPMYSVELNDCLPGIPIVADNAFAAATKSVRLIKRRAHNNEVLSVRVIDTDGLSETYELEATLTWIATVL